MGGTRKTYYVLYALSWRFATGDGRASYLFSSRRKCGGKEGVSGDAKKVEYLKVMVRTEGEHTTSRGKRNRGSGEMLCAIQALEQAPPLNPIRFTVSKKIRLFGRWSTDSFNSQGRRSIYIYCAQVLICQTVVSSVRSFYLNLNAK